MSASGGSGVLHLAAAFPTAHAALSMEKICREKSLPGRLIPTPRSISASCGMAWCAPVEAREALENAAAAENIPVEGWYYVTLRRALYF